MTKIPEQASARSSDPLPAASLLAAAPLEADEATLELINSEIAAGLARQGSSSQRLDTKAMLLVGYAGAAASFLATQHPRHVLALVAYAAFAASAASGIWAYALRLYQDVPEPRRLFTGYLSAPRAQALAALAATRVEAFESNTETHARKVRLWWISLASLAIGTALMIAALASTYW
jgi:hypothetical protein